MNTKVFLVANIWGTFGSLKYNKKDELQNMIEFKLFLIQVGTIIAILLLNSILLFTYYNFIIIDLLPLYKELTIPLHAIFVTLLTIFVLINNMKIPYSSYVVDDISEVPAIMKDELGNLISHILQSSFLVSLSVLIMALFS